MRWKSFRLAALVGVGVLALLLVVIRSLGHKLVVKAYLTNALGLRAGAPARLAGVDIGSVKSVRARPERKEAPVEVIMVLDPPYELKIPSDSTISLETAGVLGETYIDIDATSASGPPIGPNAVLRAKPTVQLTTEQIIEKVSEAFGKKGCDCDVKRDDSRVTSTKEKSSDPSH
jgi:phospholipid/cholesterol/gamma-HCH transport system substrate-binding protein